MGFDVFGASFDDVFDGRTTMAEGRVQAFEGAASTV